VINHCDDDDYRTKNVTIIKIKGIAGCWLEFRLKQHFIDDGCGVLVGTHNPVAAREIHLTICDADVDDRCVLAQNVWMFATIIYINPINFLCSACKMTPHRIAVIDSSRVFFPIPAETSERTVAYPVNVVSQLTQ
jgi:hypothetical protein